MAQRSKRIDLSSKGKENLILPENIMLYNRYEMDMNLRALSPKSIYNYKMDIYNWFMYIYLFQGNMSIKEVQEGEIEEFVFYCMKEGNNTRRIKRRLSAISAFYIFLKRKKIVTQNPTENILRPKKDVDVVTQTFLTAEQVELMFEKLKENNDLQLELYAKLSLDTMGRVNAISNIKWSQINFQEDCITDVIEKEGYTVNLFFNADVKNLLIKLKAEREVKGINLEHVFLIYYSGTYSQASVSAMFDWSKKIGKMIEIESLHPHDFRHSGSQLRMLNGMPIEEISELLNHRGLDVTKKHYLRQNKQKMKESMNKYKIF